MQFLNHIVVVMTTIGLFQNTECRPQDVQYWPSNYRLFLAPPTINYHSMPRQHLQEQSTLLKDHLIVPAYRLLPNTKTPTKPHQIFNEEKSVRKEVSINKPRRDHFNGFRDIPRNLNRGKPVKLIQDSHTQNQITYNTIEKHYRNNNFEIMKQNVVELLESEPSASELLDSKPILPFKNKNDTQDQVVNMKSGIFRLNPVANSIAGGAGTAIANPVSQAYVARGSNVRIAFEPQAVAIAGPYGIAHAQSDLYINYDDTDNN